MLSLKDNDLKQIISQIDQLTNKDLQIYEESFLLNILNKHMQALGIKMFEDYLEYLLQHTNEILLFNEMLDVNYTDFFRNSLTYACIEQNIIPELIEKSDNKNEIRIWSAGCSTGQEPYSIAMLLEEHIKKSDKNTNYRIFATDQTISNITYAIQGRFRQREVDNIKTGLLNQYFEKSNNVYSILPKIKKQIDFSNFNLLDPNFDFPHQSIYGQFDIVICCNVLIYYNQQAQKQIIDKLVKSVSKDGYLIIGEIEKQILNNVQQLSSVDLNNSIYRKV